MWWRPSRVCQGRSGDHFQLSFEIGLGWSGCAGEVRQGLRADFAEAAGSRPSSPPSSVSSRLGRNGYARSLPLYQSIPLKGVTGRTSIERVACFFSGRGGRGGTYCAHRASTLSTAFQMFPCARSASRGPPRPPHPSYIGCAMREHRGLTKPPAPPSSAVLPPRPALDTIPPTLYAVVRWELSCPRKS